MYNAKEDRYDTMHYRRSGKSGVKLPELSLGLWHNFGSNDDADAAESIVLHAFDRGITHFDLANNYGPPPGSAESFFGAMMIKNLRPFRDELIVSSKAGYGMWPGPYGDFGSRKYLVASCDQSLARMKLDYVDIFYHHRPDPDTPLEETMGALDRIVRSGRALYAGISSYDPEQTAKATAIARDLGTPLLIHQPSYSILNRWVEDGEPSLLQSAHDNGMGVIAFSPLAQGMLTSRYLDGIPADSRAAAGKSLDQDLLNEENLGHLRALNDIAKERGQSLAQMAIAWVLRDQGDASVTSALLGASSVAQLDDNLDALGNLDFTDEELTSIDKHGGVEGINLWQGATDSVQ